MMREPSDRSRDSVRRHAEQRRSSKRFGPAAPESNTSMAALPSRLDRREAQERTTESMNRRLRAFSTTPSSSSTSSSLLNISCPDRHWSLKGIGSLFGRRPSKKRKKVVHKRRHFGRYNGSSSSVDSDLAYGHGYMDRLALPSGGSGRTEEEILEIGRKLQAYAQADNINDLERSGRTRPWKQASAVGAMKTLGRQNRRQSTSKLQHGDHDYHNRHGGESGDAANDSDWESASEFEDSDDSADSGLAYGPSAHAPGEVAGDALQTRGWILQRPRDSMRPADRAIDTRCGRQRQPQETRMQPGGASLEASPTQRPMKLVHTVPTSDPARFETVTSSGMDTIASEPCVPMHAAKPQLPDLSHRLDAQRHRGRGFADAAAVAVAVAAVGRANHKQDARRRKEEREQAPDRPRHDGNEAGPKSGQGEDKAGAKKTEADGASLREAFADKQTRPGREERRKARQETRRMLVEVQDELRRERAIAAEHRAGRELSLAHPDTAPDGRLSRRDSYEREAALAKTMSSQTGTSGSTRGAVVDERASDKVQEEANQAYREHIMAQKLGAARSSSGPRCWSVLDKWQEADEEPVATNPQMKAHEQFGAKAERDGKTSTRFESPNADVRIDSVIVPDQLSLYQQPDLGPDGGWSARDPSAQRQRPWLNLVQPTPEPTPSPAVQKARQKNERRAREAGAAKEKREPRRQEERRDEAAQQQGGGRPGGDESEQHEHPRTAVDSVVHLAGPAAGPEPPSPGSAEMPGIYGDDIDFAAAVAAGLASAGLDADLVIEAGAGESGRASWAVLDRPATRHQQEEDRARADAEDETKAEAAVSRHCRPTESTGDGDGGRTVGDVDEDQEELPTAPSAASADESFLDSAGTRGAGVGLAASAPSDEDTPRGKQRARSTSRGSRLVDPEIVQRVIIPAIDPQYGDLLPLPPSWPSSPVTVATQPDAVLPALPDSRPGTPPEAREGAGCKLRSVKTHARRRSMLDTPTKSPSQTAVPLQFRLSMRGTAPSSPVQTPCTPPADCAAVFGGGSATRSGRLGRPVSWDRSRDIKPLYLLEKAGDAGRTSPVSATNVQLPASSGPSKASSTADDEGTGVGLVWPGNNPHDTVDTSTRTGPASDKRQESPDPIDVIMSKARSLYLLHQTPPSTRIAMGDGGNDRPPSGKNDTGTGGEASGFSPKVLATSEGEESQMLEDNQAPDDPRLASTCAAVVELAQEPPPSPADHAVEQSKLSTKQRQKQKRKSRQQQTDVSVEAEASLRQLERPRHPIQDISSVVQTVPAQKPLSEAAEETGRDRQLTDDQLSDQRAVSDVGLPAQLDQATAQVQPEKQESARQDTEMAAQQATSAPPVEQGAALPWSKGEKGAATKRKQQPSRPSVATKASKKNNKKRSDWSRMLQPVASPGKEVQGESPTAEAMLEGGPQTGLDLQPALLVWDQLGAQDGPKQDGHLDNKPDDAPTPRLGEATAPGQGVSANQPCRLKSATETTRPPVLAKDSVSKPAEPVRQPPAAEKSPGQTAATSSPPAVPERASEPPSPDGTESNKGMKKRPQQSLDFSGQQSARPELEHLPPVQVSANGTLDTTLPAPSGSPNSKTQLDSCEPATVSEQGHDEHNQDDHGPTGPAPSGDASAWAIVTSTDQKTLEPDVVDAHGASWSADCSGAIWPSRPSLAPSTMPILLASLVGKHSIKPHASNPPPERGSEAPLQPPHVGPESCCAEPGGGDVGPGLQPIAGMDKSADATTGYDPPDTAVSVHKEEACRHAIPTAENQHGSGLALALVRRLSGTTEDEQDEFFDSNESPGTPQQDQQQQQHLGTASGKATVDHPSTDSMDWDQEAGSGSRKNCKQWEERPDVAAKKAVSPGHQEQHISVESGDGDAKSEAVQKVDGVVIAATAESNEEDCRQPASKKGMEGKKKTKKQQFFGDDGRDAAATAIVGPGARPPPKVTKDKESAALAGQDASSPSTTGQEPTTTGATASTDQPEASTPLQVGPPSAVGQAEVVGDSNRNHLASSSTSHPDDEAACAPGPTSSLAMDELDATPIAPPNDTGKAFATTKKPNKNKKKKRQRATCADPKEQHVIVQLDHAPAGHDGQSRHDPTDQRLAGDSVSVEEERAAAVEKTVARATGAQDDPNQAPGLQETGDEASPTSGFAQASSEETSQHAPDSAAETSDKRQNRGQGRFSVDSEPASGTLLKDRENLPGPEQAAAARKAEAPIEQSNAGPSSERGMSGVQESSLASQFVPGDDASDAWHKQSASKAASETQTPVPHKTGEDGAGEAHVQDDGQVEDQPGPDLVAAGKDVPAPTVDDTPFKAAEEPQCSDMMRKPSRSKSLNQPKPAEIAMEPRTEEDGNLPASHVEPKTNSKKGKRSTPRSGAAKTLPVQDREQQEEKPGIRPAVVFAEVAALFVSEAIMDKEKDSSTPAQPKKDDDAASLAEKALLLPYEPKTSAAVGKTKPLAVDEEKPAALGAERAAVQGEPASVTEKESDHAQEESSQLVPRDHDEHVMARSGNEFSDTVGMRSAFSDNLSKVASPDKGSGYATPPFLSPGLIDNPPVLYPVDDRSPKLLTAVESAFPWQEKQAESAGGLDGMTDECRDVGGANDEARKTTEDDRQSHALGEEESTIDAVGKITSQDLEEANEPEPSTPRARRDSETLPKWAPDSLERRKRRMSISKDRDQSPPPPPERAFSLPENLADEEKFVARDMLPEKEELVEWPVLSPVEPAAEHDPWTATPIHCIPSAAEFRRSAVSGLPPVQEEELEGEQVKQRSPRPATKVNRNGGFTGDSPRHSPRPLQRGLVQVEPTRRDSGAHVRDGGESTPKDECNRDQRARRSASSQHRTDNDDEDDGAVQAESDDFKRRAPSTLEPEKLLVKKPSKRGDCHGHGCISERNSPRPSPLLRAQPSASNTCVPLRRTPELPAARPESPGSIVRMRSGHSATPPLRQADGRLDLRSVSLSQQEPTAKVNKDKSPASSDGGVPPAIIISASSDKAAAAVALVADNAHSRTTPVANEGRVRAKDASMTDVYDGYGEGRIGSPRSPTRPPSLRRRQSMQVLELESRVEQLMTENCMLADECSRFELSQKSQSASTLAEREIEVDSLKRLLQDANDTIGRLKEINEGLSSSTKTIGLQFDDQMRHLEIEHAAAQQAKDAAIQALRDKLQATKQQVRELQAQTLAAQPPAPDADFISIKDIDYFDTRCQQLCSHVQQWVLRFSKFSDMRASRLTFEISDEKIIDRLDNTVLDGSDVDTYLRDRVRRRDIFMSLTMFMIWEFVFTRYLFGMDRDQRQKLKALERQLLEVGPPHAVRQWRAVTLTLLSRRPQFKRRRDDDTEVVAQAILETLSKILPLPSHLEDQIQSQLRKVAREAVGLAIEMRSQKAEYQVLPPLQPVYDESGKLTETVVFNAQLMNERSGNDEDNKNEALEVQGATVRLVLFPLVVRKGDDQGRGDDEVVVCPAQVLVSQPQQQQRQQSTSPKPQKMLLARNSNPIIPVSDVGGASLYSEMQSCVGPPSTPPSHILEGDAGQRGGYLPSATGSCVSVQMQDAPFLVPTSQHSSSPTSGII